MNGQDKPSQEFNPGMGREAGKVVKADPHGVKADHVYKVLHEMRATASNILSMQIQINEKLINNPVDDRKHMAKEEAQDRPVNPRHLPGFVDIGKDVLGILYQAQRLQEYLISHL